jgi:hypothetical protein
MLAAVLDGLLTWAKRIRCARLGPPFEAIGAQLALFVEDLVSQFETFPVDALRRLEGALELASVESPQVIQMTMVFRLSNLEGFEREMESIRRRFSP